MPPQQNIPIINIGALDTLRGKQVVAKEIADACKEHGFFYVSGHGISPELQTNLAAKSEAFFSLPESEKMKIPMSKGGKAWRGYFPLHAELTSGKPDRKEGIYFGLELPVDHPKVIAGVPLHGVNLFPDEPQGLDQTILEYMEQVTRLGHRILQGISLSLGLDERYFEDHYTQDPLILFRVFHYPAQKPTQDEWGVGEHTDYGLLTILLQDEVGGLQVKSRGKWIDAPPIPGTFICNIGDMLDRITGGIYRSTPHRVLNKSGRNRFSFPLFFDPGFDAKVQRITGISQSIIDDSQDRWDKSNVHDFQGTYGEYLLKKIGQVFPDLGDEVF